MTNYKLLLVIFICCSFLGCDKKSTDASSTKKIEKITVVCKGKSSMTMKSEKGESTHESSVIKSYIFKVTDSTFTFETNGSSYTAPLNYEYLDQDGQPKAVGTWEVNEQKIHFKQYFWDHIDKKNDKETTNDHEISINRISGEWIERRRSSLRYKNKEWRDDYFMDVGTCENASPKF